MTVSIPGLAGHRGLRGDILLELKRAQPLTAKELADAFAVSANAVRRHLKELEAEGLVAYAREQRGTGAPTYTFRLTGNGEALFPTQYGEALTDVLAAIAQDSGREAVKALFAQRFRAHAERLRGTLADATLEEKVAAVVEMLSQQGFMAAWSVEADQVRLAEHNCAVRQAAEQFPEICAAEVEFLEEVLQSALQRDSYIPDGCNSCQYSITIGTKESDTSSHKES
ncbi:MAG: helix-turn-helix domain-containing protein [Gemmatimonadota bacterium]|nr:helix-turn-helix domain-containing protein [Gemmatimonadota bacterium]